jgi:nucleotide-binding universal stress UspA family protein
MNLRSILVAVDYSECSAKALSVAAELARVYGAALDLVHVWDRPAYVSDDTKVGHGEDARSLLDMIRENARAEMEAFTAKAALPAGTKLSTRLLAGNPAGTLLKELAGGKHDLLVIGTHGRTGLPHLLLGSVAEKLVRLSPVPVLTVPERFFRAPEPSS